MPLLIALTLAYLQFAVVFVLLHRTQRQSYLKYWTLAYVGATIHEVTLTLGAVGVSSLLLSLLGYAALLGAATGVIMGTFRFMNRPVPRILFAVAAGVGAWIGTELVVGVKLHGWYGVFSFVALALFLACTEVLRAPVPRTGRVLSAIGLFLFGVYNASLPFVSETPWFRRIEYETELVLMLAISVGVLYLHFEIARRNADLGAQRFESLFRNALEGLFRLSLDGRFLAANPALLRVLGAESESQLTELESLSALFPSRRDRRKIEAAIANRSAIELEARFERLDGSEARGLVRLQPAVGAEGEPVFEGVLHDVTESSRLREQLERSHRLEALGRLAGGIAHDFNNMLTTIIAGTDILKREIPEASHSGQLVADLAQAASRASGLTRQLLAFSSSNVGEARPTDVGQVAAGAARMLERIIGEDVHLEFRRSTKRLVVYAEPSQIEQLVMNLAVNARDAMPRGGDLFIEVAEAQSSDGRDAVRITVTDTGYGMDEATRARIFEPFFTTKAPGTGTGLGLASVFGIVNHLDGEIDVQSEPGVGSTFDLLLPLTDEAEAPASTMPPPAAVLPGLRVLVAEDHVEVRNVVARVLRRGHLHVTATGSPLEALEWGRTQRFDVLVSDVVMPDLSGPELAHQLRKTHPDLAVVLLSGYAPDSLRHRFPVDAEFLSKPFKPDALLRAVEQAAARRASSEPSEPCEPAAR